MLRLALHDKDSFAGRRPPQFPSATARPLSRLLPLTDDNRVWKRPKTLELSTEGILADSKVAPNMTGSFVYDSDTSSCQAATATSGPACSVHFSPLLHHPDVLLVTKSGDKSSYDAEWDARAPPTLPNQDCSVLLHSSRNQHKLVALLDGHGELGHYASQAVVLDLPFRLWDRLETTTTTTTTAAAGPSAIESIFKEEFVSVDQGVVSRVPEAGTTAVIMYQNDDTVYLASAGDSTAFCASYNNPQVKHTTKTKSTTMLLQAVQHKPGDPIERARIKAHGGKVTMPPPWDVGASSRVMLPGVDGMSTALAMSRCLGDEEGKQAQVLIAEPSIVSTPIQINMFCVAASDGLVDYVPVANIAEAVGEALYGTDTTRGLATVSQGLIDSSVRQWFRATGGTYRDDITMVVTRIS